MRLQYVIVEKCFSILGANVATAMHELSLALSLLDQVGAAAVREGATRVASVRLRVGRMSGVVRDALLFSWDLARADTVASDATLLIDDVAVAVWCSRCDGERAIREGEGLTCSQCGAIAPTIVRGRELELVAMEVVA
jgi:hydrogenase nickel incorporation protein HypA/HybF